jgi:sec-independent protein translocase protein TatA
MLPGGIGFSEMLVIGIVAVLLFGSRLPEVARSLGQTYQQFRKGLAEIQSTINTEIDLDEPVKKISEFSDCNEDFDEPTAPKFVPPAEDESGV